MKGVVPLSVDDVMEDGADIQFLSRRCVWLKVPVVLAFGLPLSLVDGYLRMNYPITVHHLGTFKNVPRLRTQMDPRGCDGPKHYYEPLLTP